MNGVMLAVVARKGTRRSSLLTSSADARSSERSSAARLLSVGRTIPVPGASVCAVSDAAGCCRSCVFNSAYPDWKIPTSGLSASVLQTACTSENLLLLRKTSRNVDDCRAVRRNVHSL